MFTSDQAHYEAAMEQLARTEERDFLFVITMQNHGGYDYADFRLTHGADEPFSGIADEAVRRTLANYCFLLSESDRALEDFIRDLQACPEPVTLVFFGDHIPPLGEDAYAQLGLSTADPDCFLAPYLIWHNRGNEPTRLDLEAWQLGAQALLHAGAGDDPFFAHIEALRQSGNKTDENYDLISRDVLFGKQHAYAEAGLSPANDHFRIGGEMTLSGFDAVRIADAIYLRPKLERPNQRFCLRVNGVLTDIPCVSADADELTLQCVLTRWDGLVWNQSATLAYTGAQQLLSLSDSLPMRTLPAPACELFEKKGGLQIYRSLEPLPECFFAVVTSGEERFGWQPSYGLTQPRQYALDADGHLLIALSQQDTPLLGQLSLHLLGE